MQPDSLQALNFMNNGRRTHARTTSNNGPYHKKPDRFIITQLPLRTNVTNLALLNYCTKRAMAAPHSHIQILEILT